MSSVPFPDRDLRTINKTVGRRRHAMAYSQVIALDAATGDLLWRYKRPLSAPHAVAPTMKEGPMQYYIPKMLPEHVEVEPDVFQPYSDATVAGWRNEQRLATQQGKHQRAGVTQMVLLADKLQIAESVPLYPYLVRLGDVEKFRFLLDR